MKDVRIVPAFAQRRVAEDEAQWLIQREQPLLVPHDEIIHVVIRLRHSARVFEDALLILREVAVVKLLQRQRRHGQRAVAILHDELPKCLLESRREFPLHRLSLLIVAPVVRHLVDEEKRQHFQPFAAHLQFLVEMPLHRVFDLHAGEVFAHAALFLPETQHAAVVELHVFIARLRIDFRHDVAVAIRLPVF